MDEAEQKSLHDRTYEAAGDLPELPSIDDCSEDLVEMLGEHQRLLMLASSGGIEEIDPVDHLVMAALMRSIATIHGFLGMVEQRNKLCALPMVRFQLDSAMRLFASGIVDKSRDNDFVQRILEGEKPSRFKDVKGKNLTDAYLHSELAKQYEEVTRIYNDTSGFVHLSQNHLVSIFDLRRSTESKMAFVDFAKLVEWEDREIRGVMVEFVYATGIILAISRSWEEWKLTRRRSS